MMVWMGREHPPHLLACLPRATRAPIGACEVDSYLGELRRARARPLQGRHASSSRS